MSDVLNLYVRDVSGQRSARVPKVPGDMYIDQFVRRITHRMGLAAEDATEQPQAYHLYLDEKGEARHLGGGEVVGAVLKDDQTVVLHPDIQAG